MKVKLADVAENIFAGGDVPKDKFSAIQTETYNVPIYANAEKDDGLYGYTDVARVTEPCVTVAARGTIGFVAKRATPFFPVIRLITVIPQREKITLDYLYYALRYCKLNSSGTSIPQLTVPDIKEYSFELINVEKQHKITEILDKVDRLMKMQQRQLEQLDLLVKCRFVEMFGDPKINEKCFVKAPMGDYMTLLTDFSSNGSYKTLDSGVTMYDEPNYAWMVRTTDLESGDMSAIKYIDEKAYELLAKSKIFGGEIIMNKIGSAGKVYLMPQISMPASLGRNAFMFRYDERINVKYLYYLLISDYGQNEIQQYVKGAVTKTITKNDARAIKIIVPPKTLQDEFVAFVEQVDKSKVAIQKSLDEMQLLFDSLMQKYFG